MKCATTYLSELLGAHPEVFMSSPKEPCHFVDPHVLRHVWPEMWRNRYWASEERYLALFARAGNASVIGEASVFYSQEPLFADVPQRIVGFNKDARFIYIMRDPVERTISHYWHRVRWWGEHRSMLRAIRSDPQYRDISNYARQLRAYLRYVPSERIYVLTCEALAADPAQQLRALYAWLGVDPRFQPRSLGVPVNVTPEVVQRPREFGLLQHLQRTATYVRIAPLLPLGLRRAASKLASRPVNLGDVSTSAVQDYLRPRQQRETEELAALLNRSFPEWRTLYGAAQPADAQRTLPGAI